MTDLDKALDRWEGWELGDPIVFISHSTWETILEAAREHRSCQQPSLHRADIDVVRQAWGVYSTETAIDSADRMTAESILRHFFDRVLAALSGDSPKEDTDE